MHVCMCACVLVCMCACVHVCTGGGMHVRRFVRASYVHVHVRVRVRVQVCMCAYVHVRMRMCVCACACPCVHMCMCTYAHVHVRVHAHAHVCICACACAYLRLLASGYFLLPTSYLRLLASGCHALSERHEQTARTKSSEAFDSCAQQVGRMHMYACRVSQGAPGPETLTCRRTSFPACIPMHTYTGARMHGYRHTSFRMLSNISRYAWLQAYLIPHALKHLEELTL